MAVYKLEDVQVALQAHRVHTHPTGEDASTAAVAALFRKREELELLFIRRAENPKDPWSGHMAFPGGRRDEQDASSLDAAIRETQEEVAFDLEQNAYIMGQLSPVQASAKGRPVPLVVHPFVFGTQDPSPQIIPDTKEVQEAIWVPFSLFTNHAQHRSTLQIEYLGQLITLPCHRYQGRVIWGLTLRMIDELVSLLNPP